MIADAGAPAGVTAYADGVQAASALALGADDLVPAGWRPHLRLAAVGRIPAGTGSRPADRGRQFPDGGYTVAREGVAEGGELARGAQHLGLVPVVHGHARAVIAPVLEPPEPIEENRRALFVGDVANNSAHRLSPRSGAGGSDAPEP